MAVCRWRYAGRVPYAEALALQKETVRRRVAKEIPDTLILVEHPPVITLGKMAKREHLLNGSEHGLYFRDREPSPTADARHA